MLTLYSSPGSCALAPHIALEEAGADYQLARVHFDREEQRSAAFLALNPLGRVPVLATDEGVLTECPAILGYIAAGAPGAKLAPAEPYAAAKMAAFLAFVSSTVHPTFTHVSRPYRWADDEACRRHISAKAVWSYREVFAMIEDGKLIGPWVMGEQYTVADPYLFVMAHWLPRAGIDIADFPRIADHYARMAQRPAVRAVLPHHKRD